MLVIYDIIDNKKRTKLAKVMCSFGFRVQKSSFEAYLSESKYSKMLSQIYSFVSERDGDSIRVYKIRGKAAVTVLGKDDTPLPETVVII